MLRESTVTYRNEAADVSATCVYRWAIYVNIGTLCIFGIFYFFLRIVNRCDNIDTEIIKLIVLTYFM